MTRAPRTLCFDIGGTGIKGLVADVKGKPLSERVRIETPHPAIPKSLLRVLGEIHAQQPAFDRVSAGFPGVVREGVVYSAPNLDPSWVGVNLAGELTRICGKPARVANDAGVQGMGVIAGKGTEIVLTLGTGMGFALFRDGRYVPNIELGHHPIRGKKVYEDLVCDRERKKHLKRWNRRVQFVLSVLEPCFNYDHLYIGGGNAERLSFKLPGNVTVVSNDAGMLGGVRLWDQ
ncbi:MAG: ROK family protein [Acidobacteriota bacterium]